MSDEQNEKSPTSPSRDNMTARLASLRASIRASKSRQDEDEADEPEVALTEGDDTPDDTSVQEAPAAATAPMAVSQSSEQLDIAPDDDFAADDTQISLSSDELPDQPQAEHNHQLHVGETAAAADHSGLLAQMDQVSEAAADQEETTSGYDDPTIIQNVEDLAFVQGTPLYMSPEQCQNAAVSPATDVYSLGVVMYELLEGFPPYIAESVEEVLLMHQDAPIPGQRSEFTPPEVRDLVRSMLAKNPQNRPTTAEIIDVLQRHVSIGGADVHGLEEESWSVSEVQDNEPETQPYQQPQQAQPYPLGTMNRPDATVAAQPESQSDLPPIWIVGMLALGLIAAIGLAVVISSDEDGAPEPVPPEPASVVSPNVEPTRNAEPIEEKVQPEQTAEAPEDPEPDGMEFGVAEASETPDAGAASADAGSEADSGKPQEEPAVKKAPKRKKRKKRRRRRPRRRKKKKKEELEELRLDL